MQFIEGRTSVDDPNQKWHHAENVTAFQDAILICGLLTKSAILWYYHKESVKGILSNQLNMRQTATEFGPQRSKNSII